MKKFLWLFFLILLFLLSYLREICFISMNALIAGQSHNYANTQLPAFFYQLDPAELSQLKWLLTIFFSLLFIALSYFGLRFAVSKAASLWLILIYSAIIGAAILSLSIMLFQDFNYLYPFLRMLIGIIHSPLLFIMISTSHYAIKVLKKY